MADVIEVSPRAPVCQVVRAAEPFVGKQGLLYAPAISAETVGSCAIHMQLVTIPPGGREKAHKQRRMKRLSMYSVVIQVPGTVTS